MEINDEKKEARRLYMREYMKTRYHLDVEKSRKYKNTIVFKSKNKNTISNDDSKKYGEHLVDVIHLRKIFSTLPKVFLIEEINKIELNV